MTKSENILITGGAGFIGRALTQHFLDQGHFVTIFDSFRRDSLQYFAETRSNPRLKIISGDICDAGAVRAAVLNPDYVFHLAAIAGVSKYFSIPVEVMQVNIQGTFNLLEAIKGVASVKACFDFSTSEIYGSNCFQAREDSDVKMEKVNARRWTYATSKIASEKIGMAYYWQHKVPFIGIRPFNVYGPGQTGEGVISKFVTKALAGQTIEVTGDGSQCRTYCYVDDFVTGIQCILDNLEACTGTSINIGCQTEMISVLSLAEMVFEVCGAQSRVEFIRHQGDDVRVRSPDISRLASLGFKPKYRLRDGLAKTIDWYRNHQVVLD